MPVTLELVLKEGYSLHIILADPIYTSLFSEGSNSVFVKHKT